MSEAFGDTLLLERYRLGPALGRRTWIARDEQASNRRSVVMKRVHVDEQGDPGAAAVFDREVRALRRVRNPAVPMILDSFESPLGHFWLVSERVPGASLGARSHLSEGEAREVLGSALRTLGQLHALQPAALHMDLQPSHLVKDSGRITLVDFGGPELALCAHAGTAPDEARGFRAPELLDGRPTSPATDMYGLGATMVTLLGGLPPSEVPRRGPAMDLRGHLPAVTPGLLTLLEAMTDPDPAARVAGVEAALALLAAPAGTPAAMSAPAPAAPPAPAPAPTVATGSGRAVIELHLPTWEIFGHLYRVLEAKGSMAVRVTQIPPPGSALTLAVRLPDRSRLHFEALVGEVLPPDGAVQKVVVQLLRVHDASAPALVAALGRLK